MPNPADEAGSDPPWRALPPAHQPTAPRSSALCDRTRTRLPQQRITGRASPAATSTSNVCCPCRESRLFSQRHTSLVPLHLTPGRRYFSTSNVHDIATSNSTANFWGREPVLATQVYYTESDLLRWFPYFLFAFIPPFLVIDWYGRSWLSASQRWHGQRVTTQPLPTYQILPHHLDPARPLHSRPCQSTVLECSAHGHRAIPVVSFPAFTFPSIHPPQAMGSPIPSN